MRLPPKETFHLVRARINDALPKLPAAHPLRLRVAQALAAPLAVKLWTGAGALLLLLLVWLAWPRALAVETAAIDRGVVRHEIVDEGRTRIHDVFVIAAPVAGELQRVELEPGDRVARGDIVATILPADPALLDARVAAEARAAIAAAQAALAAAQAARGLSARDHARIAQLHARSFAAQAALDGANAQLRAARAEEAARRADLARARAAAGSPTARARAPTPVRAPAAGRVLRVLQQSQTLLAGGAPILEIGEPADLEVVAEFLSQDAVLMREGARASIEAWGGETPIPAQIFRIEPYARTKISVLGVEEQRVNVIVRLAAPDEAPPLGHGFRVDVRVIALERENELRAPVDALVRDGAGWAVFRIDHGRARLTPVALGDGGGEFRAVRQGLSEGDRVILFPSDALRDGERVHPAR